MLISSLYLFGISCPSQHICYPIGPWGHCGCMVSQISGRKILSKPWLVWEGCTAVSEQVCEGCRGSTVSGGWWVGEGSDQLSVHEKRPLEEDSHVLSGNF